MDLQGAIINLYQVSSIFYGSHQSKSILGDRKQEDTNSKQSIKLDLKESVRLDSTHGSSRRYYQCLPGHKEPKVYWGDGK
jgi:hypothetical protein